MSSTAHRCGEVLPERARLLHIGVPKTGTTALQQAAATNRDALLRHGVRYPGSGTSHRHEFAALMGRDTIWTAKGPAYPTPAAWKTLMAEMAGDPERRIFLSHEYAAAATDEQAARFLDELGPRIHVVIGVRNYPELLTSRWQQYVKSGLALSFDDWLAGVLSDPPLADVTPGFHANSDQGAIVERWCRVVGTERVTVVVTDKGRPLALPSAVGALLGVPADLLHLSRPSRSTNRSLSLAEAELIRGLNAVARKDPRLWSRHQDLVRSGVVRRLQAGRRPRPDEQLLRLPTWAASVALEVGGRHAEQIASSGCRVFGELSLLHRPTPSTADGSKPDDVPFDAALEALVGMMRAGARPRPRGALGRPLDSHQTASRWGRRLGRVLPADRMPPAVRRKIRFVRRVRRGSR